MRKFNICFVIPKGYIHAYAFQELVESLYFSLLELGYEAQISPSRIVRGQTNIIVGCHLLDPSHSDELPRDSIILNTEQIYDSDKPWDSNIFKWFDSGFEVWDYSKKNIEKFNSLGLSQVKKLDLGFQKELVRVPKKAERDIDVLFYGSLNDRRRLILEDLHKLGLKVKVLFGVYAKERDQWIGRSKVVLNHHFHKSEIFEVVRVFYLLTNSMAVVGEVNQTTSVEPRYEQGIIPSPYQSLVERTVEAVRDEKLRLDCEQRAFETIARHPQSQFTKALLQTK